MSHKFEQVLTFKSLYGKHIHPNIPTVPIQICRNTFIQLYNLSSCSDILSKLRKGGHTHSQIFTILVTNFSDPPLLNNVTMVSLKCFIFIKRLYYCDSFELPYLLFKKYNKNVFYTLSISLLIFIYNKPRQTPLVDLVCRHYNVKTSRGK